MSAAKKSTEDKYLEFLTHLYEKEVFNIAKELKDKKINRALYILLEKNCFIEKYGEKGLYKFFGEKPSIKEVRKLIDDAREYHRSVERGKHNKNVDKSEFPPIIIDKEEEALEILRNSKKWNYEVFRSPKEIKKEKLF